MKPDISGIPDVDLGPVKADLEENQKDDEKGLDLGQFKTAEDLLKSYKEIQGAFTKVSQENKGLAEQAAATQQLKDELDSLRQQQELSSYSAPSHNQQKSFDESWMENPEQTIAQQVTEQLNLARINDVLESEDVSNPSEFQERYAYVDMLARNPQYAPLAKTPAGIKRLFKEADKLRESNLKNTLGKALSFLNDGNPLSEEQLAKAKKTLFGGIEQINQTNQNNDAYMPDGSTSTKSGADQNQVSNEISESASKGDVDGVLDGIFKNILA